MFRSHLYYSCSFSLNVKFCQNKQKDTNEERGSGSDPYHEITRVDDNCIECDGGSELGGVELWSDLATWDFILQYYLPHEDQQKVTVKVSCKVACPWQVWASRHIWLLFSASFDPILGLQCATLETKHSAPFLKTQFWLLSSATLCLVIILSPLSYGLRPEEC